MVGEANRIIQMTRTGEFPVVWHKDATSQCGWSGNEVLRYKVHLVAPTSALDDRGFIIDNMEVNKYFRNKYRDVQVFKSCETIALDSIDDFCAMLPNCTYIEVSISGEPDAVWLTASAGVKPV